MPRGVTKLSLLLSAALLLVACGPFLLLPGGKLEGESAPAPGSWAFTDDVSTVQLETLPADPYSVNIWVVGMGSVLYVHAGASRSTWVENMEQDPNVRMLVEGKLYDLRASRVEGEEEFKRFADVYEKKYGNRPRNENIAEIYLFRLESS